jgi:hypothetical protein
MAYVNPLLLFNQKPPIIDQPIVQTDSAAALPFLFK